MRAVRPWRATRHHGVRPRPRSKIAPPCRQARGGKAAAWRRAGRLCCGAIAECLRGGLVRLARPARTGDDPYGIACRHGVARPRRGRRAGRLCSGAIAESLRVGWCARWDGPAWATTPTLSCAPPCRQARGGVTRGRVGRVWFVWLFVAMLPSAPAAIRRLGHLRGVRPLRRCWSFPTHGCPGFVG